MTVPLPQSSPLGKTCVHACVCLWIGGALALGASAARAQSHADMNSTDLSVGYRELLREYEALRPRPAGDSARTEEHRRDPFRMEIDGLVVDETQSKIGRDFYDAFYAGWEAPQGAVNFTVTVREQPVPSRGARVTVQVNDEMVFRANLQPKLDYIEAAARQAVYYARRGLQEQAPLQIY